MSSEAEEPASTQHAGAGPSEQLQQQSSSSFRREWREEADDDSITGAVSPGDAKRREEEEEEEDEYDDDSEDDAVEQAGKALAAARVTQPVGSDTGTVQHESNLMTNETASSWPPGNPEEEEEEEAAAAAAAARPAASVAFESMSRADYARLGRKSLRRFLQTRTCYDSMPSTGRVVIFDCNVNMRMVLNALLEHEIHAAPLWHPAKQALVGLVTKSDFSDLAKFADGNSELQQILEQHTVLSWRLLLKDVGSLQSGVSTSSPSAHNRAGERCARALSAARQSQTGAPVPPASFVTVPSTATLLDAVHTLISRRIHRLPVVDDKCQTCYAIVTPWSVLGYLARKFRDERKHLFAANIYELNIGTFDHERAARACERMGGSAAQLVESTPARTQLVTVGRTATLETVLELMTRHRVSSIPIVDEEGRVLDVYRRAFTAHLLLYAPAPSPAFATPDGGIVSASASTSAAEASAPPPNPVPTVTLSEPVLEVLTRLYASWGVQQVRRCSPLDSMQAVMVTFAESKARTLFVVDEKQALLGVCALADVLAYFVRE